MFFTVGGWGGGVAPPQATVTKSGTCLDGGMDAVMLMRLEDSSEPLS